MATTATDKATKLVESFRVVELSDPEDVCKTFRPVTLDVAKVYASVCIDNILDALKNTLDHLTLNELDDAECIKDVKFWCEVKEEIKSVELFYLDEL